MIDDTSKVKPKKRDLTTIKNVDESSKLEKVVKEHKRIYKKVHTPTKKEWFKEYYRVVFGIVALGLFLMGIDWLFVEGVILFQSFIAGPGLDGIGAGLFITLIVLSGLLLSTFILLQRGTSDGLTSLFGSSVEFGGSSIAGLTSKLSTVTIIVGSFFVFLCLISPLVLR